MSCPHISGAIPLRNNNKRGRKLPRRWAGAWQPRRDREAWGSQRGPALLCPSPSWSHLQSALSRSLTSRGQLTQNSGSVITGPRNRRHTGLSSQLSPSTALRPQSPHERRRVVRAISRRGQDAEGQSQGSQQTTASRAAGGGKAQLGGVARGASGR